MADETGRRRGFPVLWRSSQRVAPADRPAKARRACQRLRWIDIKKQKQKKQQTSDSKKKRHDDLAMAFGAPLSSGSGTAAAADSVFDGVGFDVSAPPF